MDDEVFIEEFEDDALGNPLTSKPSYLPGLDPRTDLGDGSTLEESLLRSKSLRGKTPLQKAKPRLLTVRGYAHSPSLPVRRRSDPAYPLSSSLPHPFASSGRFPHAVAALPPRREHADLVRDYHLLRGLRLHHIAQSQDQQARRQLDGAVATTAHHCPRCRLPTVHCHNH